MISAGLDTDLCLDPGEERGLRMEDEPVRARLDVSEVVDAPVVVGLPVGDQLLWGAAEPLRRMVRILLDAGVKQ